MGHGKKKYMDKIILSPNTLNLFLECPKCFWSGQVKGIHRPKTVFPSLPGGMDSVLKKYFDVFRARKSLPPEIEGKVIGRLLDDEALLGEWRNNRRGIRWYDKDLDAELMGALDDCLVDGEYFIPVDYKTRVWNAKSDSHSYYQNQLNIYTLLLEKNGYPHRSFAYLVFYSPKEVLGGGKFLFNVEPRKVEVEPARAEKIFQAAVKTIRSPQPKAHSTCEFCSWGSI